MACEPMPYWWSVIYMHESRFVSLFWFCCLHHKVLTFVVFSGAGHQLLEYELGSTSNPDAYAPEIKAGLEPDSQQVGPLLGSCMSAPSSPSIVSRDNSFRLNLSDEMVGEVLGGTATSQRGLSMEVEPDTLASVEHEMLLAHSAFISPDSVAGESSVRVSLFVVFQHILRL
jgi:hypothetical protein